MGRERGYIIEGSIIHLEKYDEKQTLASCEFEMGGRTGVIKLNQFQCHKKNVEHTSSICVSP